MLVACTPAFNEERTIAGIVLRTMKHVNVVLVCDDGSAGLTGEIARGMGAEVLVHERNRGSRPRYSYGTSMLRGTSAYH
ncbi:MAG: hypothetical protein QW291_09255 [Thermofilaceae archaeon]